MGLTWSLCLIASRSRVAVWAVVVDLAPWRDVGQALRMELLLLLDVFVPRVMVEVSVRIVRLELLVYEVKLR